MYCNDFLQCLLMLWEVYDSTSLNIYELLVVCFFFFKYFCVGMEKTKG